MTRRAVAVLLAVFGCAGAPSEPAPDAKRRTDEASNVGQPEVAVDLSKAMAAVCKEPCQGNYSRNVVFRDADGKAKRIRHDGDIEACSHPPRVYFDLEGAVVYVVPMEPVTAEEAEALAKKQAAAVEGLTEAERVTCP